MLGIASVTLSSCGGGNDLDLDAEPIMESVADARTVSLTTATSSPLANVATVAREGNETAASLLGTHRGGL